jgi:hypothetical protein
VWRRAKGLWDVWLFPSTQEMARKAQVIIWLLLLEGDGCGWSAFALSFGAKNSVTSGVP